MVATFQGRIQSGKNDASHWLSLFNDAYSRKIKTPIFPGSLNLALDEDFNWFEPSYQPHIIWFGQEEYGGERDILLLPCTLLNLNNHPAYLWSTTTAARSVGY